MSQLTEVRERIESYGLEPCGPAPSTDFLAAMRRFEAEWQRIAKASRIRFE